MHQFKNDKINMINTMYNTRKFVEMDNRQKFNQRREKSTHNIIKNITSVHTRNRSQVAGVKDETKKNEQCIFKDRQRFQFEK